jgi:hypothetical protein
MPKSDINFNSRSHEQDQKEISSGLGNRLDLLMAQTFWMSLRFIIQLLI